MVQGLAALFAPDSQFKRQNTTDDTCKAPVDAVTAATRTKTKRKHQPSDAAPLTSAKKPKKAPETTAAPDTVSQPATEPQTSAGKLSRKQRKAAKAAAQAAKYADSDDEAPATALPTRHAPTAEQEAEKLQRTVFVGNLPADVKKKQLVRLFSPCGAVAAVRLRSVPLPLDSKLWRTNAVKAGVVDAARGPAHAYVVFEDVGAVDVALKLNMTLYQGLHLRVDRAVPRSSRLEAATNRFDKKSHTDKNKNNSAAASQTNALPAAYDPSRSVFVGNLHFETQDEEVICLFNESEDMGDLVGQVEAVRCVRDGATHVGKGIAFVLFKDKAAARAALGLAGTTVHGRAIRVERCKATPRSVNASAARVRVTAKGDSTLKKQAPPKRVARVGAGAFVAVKDAPWQGTKTSAGRGKGPPKVRGLAPNKLRAAASKTTNNHPAAAGRTTLGRRKTEGKRPSVLARKNKQRATQKKNA